MAAESTRRAGRLGLRSAQCRSPTTPRDPADAGSSIPPAGCSRRSCSPSATGAGVADAEIADRMLEELPGWKVGGPVALGRALIERGAVPTRHAHVHSRDLRRHPAPAGWADPALPPGVRIGPLDRSAAELAAI